MTLAASTLKRQDRVARWGNGNGGEIGEGWPVPSGSASGRFKFRASLPPTHTPHTQEGAPMSRFSGPQRKGAAKQVRDQKRLEAFERDERLPTLSQRRRRYRLAAQALEELS